MALRKIPGRYRDLAFMLIMTVLMGLVISGVRTAWQGHGDRPFLLAWLVAFASTYVIVLPTVLVVGPIARRITAAVTEAAS